MKTKLKIYVYEVKELKCNLYIYASDKKQADQLVELYQKKCNKTCQYKKIGKSKKHIEQLKTLLNKFGSDDNLIQAQLNILKEDK